MVLGNRADTLGCARKCSAHGVLVHGSRPQLRAEHAELDYAAAIGIDLTRAVLNAYFSKRLMICDKDICILDRMRIICMC
jgi:hypothetical protein